MANDLIRRADAIDVVKGIDSYFVKYIEELPTAQPEQRWISNDKKPPEEGYYLVWMPWVPPKHMAVAEYRGGCWNIKTPITAWMPLPEPYRDAVDTAISALEQPEIIRCRDCIYYDSPHVENNGERIEYSEMPKDAFDVLGVGLVSNEYGINIGGRCLRDYNVGYSEDKRVFVSETNYCGRAERRTDEAD